MSGVGTTHHVKIGDNYQVLNPGGYRRRPAPTFGARVSSGDPDYTNLGAYQHWVQNCWIGGLGAAEWTDDAMYDKGIGCDTTDHESLKLSRDLRRGTNGGLSGNTDKKRYIIYNEKLYCVTMPETAGTTSKLYIYTGGTPGTWTLAFTFASYRVQFIGKAFGALVVGGDLVGGVIKFKTSTAPDTTWTDRAAPAGAPGSATAMGFYNGKMYMSFQNEVWRFKKTWATDGSTVYYEAASDKIINNFKNHLGFMYFSSKDAHVFRTDSNSGNTFDIWAWDGFTYITSMQSYDGKLFIATYEYTDTTDLGQGALYQLTGSAVTMLKKWGNFDRATTIGRMIVYDRKLWYGAAGLWSMHKSDAAPTVDLGGFGVAQYDCVEDSHSIWATNKDTTTYPDRAAPNDVGIAWIVDDVAFFKGKLHAAVRDYGLFESPLSYRDYLENRATYDTSSTNATGVSSQGWITSSDYDGGTPGLLKHWSKFTVHADLTSDNVWVALSYSTNNGKSWDRAGAIKRTLTGTVTTVNGNTTATGAGTNFRNEVLIGDTLTINGHDYVVADVVDFTTMTLATPAIGTGSGFTATHTKKRFNRSMPINVFSPRMKYRLELHTSVNTDSPVVYGVAASYLPRPDPNWMWELSFPVVARMELLDSTDNVPSVETIDTDARLRYYRNLFRSQKPFCFTDIDGRQWADGGSPGVIMWDYMEDLHVKARAGDPTECLVRMVLLETTESFTISTQ